MWINITIVVIIKDGDKINKYTLDISVPPNLEARSHHAMYTFGNHIWVFHVENI